MAGIRLTGGGVGCPPTENPPDDYKTPFRVDSNGALWITSCFPTFTYFGEARHDVQSPVAIGSDSARVNVAGDIENGVGITAGKYTTRTIVNTTPCTLGILLGHTVSVNMTTRHDNFVAVSLSERWNGENHSVATVSGQYKANSTDMARRLISSSASPHDVNAVNGGSTLQLAPGASAVVGARLMVRYYIGAPAPGEMFWLMSSAVRIYGYVLG